MNKTYELSDRIHSNNGIYEAFYAEVVTPAFSRKSSVIGVVASLKKLWQILTGAAAKRLATVTVAILSILGIVGIAGSIQHEKISLFGGISIAVICLCIEHFCLKSLEKSNK